MSYNYLLQYLMNESTAIPDGLPSWQEKSAMDQRPPPGRQQGHCREGKSDVGWAKEMYFDPKLLMFALSTVS